MNPSARVFPPTPPKRRKGMVAWWNEIKGYGFIRPDEASVDDFVAPGSVTQPGPLAIGQCVTFLIINGPKGPQAHQVSPISDVTC